jgi:hypothetical protein
LDGSHDLTPKVKAILIDRVYDKLQKMDKLYTTGEILEDKLYKKIQ